MFEKELDRFRKSVTKTITDFFGKDATVVSIVNWENVFVNKYNRMYDIDKVKFSDVAMEHREDMAKYRTINYFLTVLDKLDELETVIRGGNYDSK